MALAIDSSSPAAVSQAVSSSATTASFNPPASVLVACVAVLDQGSVPTVSISNNGAALTWTRIVVEDRSNGQPNGSDSIWYAVLPSSRTGMTVTVTNSTFTVGFKLYVVTGADTSSPVGASQHGSSTSNNFNTTSFSSTRANSLAFCSAGQYVTNGPSPVLTNADSSVQVSGPFAVFGYKALGATGSSASFNVTDSASTRAINWVTAEIKAATGAVLTQTASDSITISDSVARGTVDLRAVGEVVSGTDAATRGVVGSQVRGIRDSVTAIESIDSHRSAYLTSQVINDLAYVTTVTPTPTPTPAVLPDGTLVTPARASSSPSEAGDIANVGLYADVTESITTSDDVDFYPDQKIADVALAADFADVAYSQDVADAAATVDVANVT